MEIRKATNADIIQVMQFINDHWKVGHILSESMLFMDWQHKSNKGYDFIIAVEKEAILAILGYIDNLKYEASSKNRIIWLALWKVRDDVRNSGLGLKLVRFLQDIEKPDLLGVNGTKKDHHPIYQMLGFEVFSLSCFFIINEFIPSKILGLDISRKVSNRPIVEHSLILMNSSSLAEMDWSYEDSVNESIKTPSYFDARYLKHPVYNYCVYTIVGDSHRTTLISTRIVSHEGSKVLRVVDYSGDLKAIQNMAYGLTNLMIAENIEYVDFWQYGIDRDFLIQAGFKDLDSEPGLLIPNFYEPFVYENGSIHSTLKCQVQHNYVVCKGDGDQDRPSKILDKL